MRATDDQGEVKTPWETTHRPRRKDTGSGLLQWLSEVRNRGPLRISLECSRQLLISCAKLRAATTDLQDMLDAFNEDDSLKISASSAKRAITPPTGSQI